MKLKITWLFFVCVLIFQSNRLKAQADSSQIVPGKWSVERIASWYKNQPWFVGANYYPATAINQIEMWQASTWDPTTIDKELKLAQSIGMNTMRVFLHDMVWTSDEKGLYKRMDQFLGICAKYIIKPSFVFFDDCHYLEPKLGVQPLPVRAWHNSGWNTSPARELGIRFAKGTATDKEIANLKGYVQKTIKRFKNDPRVLYWDLYNEPGRGTGESGTMEGSKGTKTSMGDLSAKLVLASWEWARDINPSQPITSCTYGSLGELNMAICHRNSDFHTIHSYGSGDMLQNTITNYKREGRPLVVTEWLARTNNSTVEDCLPVMKNNRVGAICWGFVSGKTGTVWPWSSRAGIPNVKYKDVNQKRLDGEVLKLGEVFPEPEVWFHDLFRMDGSPFSQAEIEIFRKLTTEVNGTKNSKK